MAKCRSFPSTCCTRKTIKVHHPSVFVIQYQSDPSTTPSVNQSQMFPSSLRYYVLGRGAGVPLRPPAVVHGHPRVPALVGRQHHVTRRDGRAARGAKRAAEVHASPGKQSLELLPGQEVARLRQEGVEGHAGGAGDVARLRVCQSETENRMSTICV